MTEQSDFQQAFLDEQIENQLNCDSFDAERVKIKDVKMREKSRIVGVIKSILLDPIRQRVEVEISDGSADLTLVWLGKRKILGLNTDIIISVMGVIATEDDRKVIYNPAYDLGSRIQPPPRHWQYV